MPTSKTSVKLVCFDLGGVLVRIARGWADACQRAGVDLPHANQALWAKHQQLMLRYETGEIDAAGYMAEAPGLIGGGVKPDAIVKVFDAWLLGMYPGAPDLLEELRSHGFKTACLSNTNQHHWDMITRLEAYRPLQQLDYRLASHELRVMKPNEQAYRRTETATGFWGEQVLFFDDKPENVAAARAVNWKAETIDRTDDAVPQIRDYLAAHGVF
jgi:glucose-1-phosphatase